MAKLVRGPIPFPRIGSANLLTIIVRLKFLSGDIRSAIGHARDACGAKNVMVIGADVARQCIQEGLIDEIVVYLAPVLLGDDVRFFKVADAPEATTATGDESRRLAMTGQCTLKPLDAAVAGSIFDTRR